MTYKLEIKILCGKYITSYFTGSEKELDKQILNLYLNSHQVTGIHEVKEDL